MKTIAVIRSNLLQARGLIDGLRTQPARVVDVHHPSLLRFPHVKTQGEPEVLLAGTPLGNFDRIFFCGAPADSRAVPELEDDDERYRFSERYAALMTVLSDVRARTVNADACLVNPGWLGHRADQLRKLAAIGWTTPAVEWSFDFAAADGRDSLFPPREEGRRIVLVATANGQWWFDEMGEMTDQLPATFGTNVALTRSWLREIGLDFSVIPVAFHSDKVFAYGLSSQIPDGLPSSVLCALLNDILSS